MQLILLILTVFLFSSCGTDDMPSDSSESDSALVGTKWTLTQITYETGTSIIPPTTADHTLLFNDDGTLYYSRLGCNILSIQNNYSIDGDTINIDRGYVSTAFCSGDTGAELMQFDEEYRSALVEAYSFTLQLDELEIKFGNGSTMHFAPFFEGCSNPIEVVKLSTDLSSDILQINLNQGYLSASSACEFAAAFELSHLDFTFNNINDCSDHILANANMSPQTLKILSCDVNVSEIMEFSTSDGTQ